MTFYSLDISTAWIVWPGFLQGIGMGFIFVPISTIAYTTLERSRVAEAAGVFSLLRTVGSAVGISIITTVMSHQAQVIWNGLGGHINMYNSAVRHYAGHLGLAATDPHAVAVIAAQVGAQAQMGAMLDAFVMIAWSYVPMLPMLLLLKKPKGAIARSTVAAD
jgi:DHA2 family multidrug resistance protein